MISQLRPALMPLFACMALAPMGAAQTPVQGSLVERDIEAHFTKVPSRLQRANGFKRFGATLTQVQPSPETLEMERRLVEAWEKEPLGKSVGQSVLVLAHEVAPHAPQLAARVLRRVATRPFDPVLAGLLRVTVLAAGPEGEAVAVDWLLEGRDGWPSFSASLLNAHARELQTGDVLWRRLREAAPGGVKAEWFRPLASIGHVPAQAEVLRQIHQALRDEIQQEAIWTFAELCGFEGIGPLASVQPLGPKSQKELTESLAWLRRETSTANPHGLEMSSDPDFAARFEDLPTPSMQWLRTRKLLGTEALTRPSKLSSKDTHDLLAQLIESQAFGLEACKGILFNSLGPEHEGSLLKLATVNWWSPDGQSQGRGMTLGILLRKVRYKRGEAKTP
ncbi:MAG TPA: hypothetical protein VJ505_00300 [Holophagaceae bacterium]|nr:hypothetical protein [Holophagaceae bacterium]